MEAFGKWSGHAFKRPRGYRRVKPGFGLSQQPPQFLGIQPVTADHRAIEQKDGDVEPMAALQHGVAVDIHFLDGRPGQRTSEGVEFSQHLVAELTVLTMHDCEASVSGCHS